MWRIFSYVTFRNHVTHLPESLLISASAETEQPFTPRRDRMAAAEAKGLGLGQRGALRRKFKPPRKVVPPAPRSTDAPAYFLQPELVPPDRPGGIEAKAWALVFQRGVAFANSHDSGPILCCACTHRPRGFVGPHALIDHATAMAASSYNTHLHSALVSRLRLALSSRNERPETAASSPGSGSLPPANGSVSKRRRAVQTCKPNAFKAPRQTRVVPPSC